MTNGRRNSDRRRRVLYTAHHADSNPSTAASRREAERLREARRPTAAYGMRVKRRLRGRWFSLVPVRRRTLITTSSVLFGISLLLCAAHYASVAWPSIAYRPEIARPLRLDRPDSFGRWITCVMLTGSAGASLLIYQLRRYRIDDYQGRYRLWRLVLIVLMLASVNSLVSIIDWSGALLDAGLGRRVALSGSDWIRLVVSIGGAILSLRLIAEVRHSRWALLTMILACTLLSLPEAAKWNVIKLDSVGVWALVTSAPLLAFTSLFISLGGYLRMLYREVRQIDEGDSWAIRVQRFRLRVLQRTDDGTAGDDRDKDEDQDDSDRQDEPKRHWWRRQSSSPRRDRQPGQQENDDWEDDVEEKVTQVRRIDTAAVPDDGDDRRTDESARPGRRWFGLRRAKSATGGDDRSGVEEQAKPKQETKRRFSLRLDPAAAARSNQKADQKSEQADGESDAKPKRGLGGWFRGRKSPAEQDVASDDPPESTARRPPRQGNDEQEIDADDIDWDAMSKTERRRLRKKLRRQGRAA